MSTSPEVARGVRRVVLLTAGLGLISVVVIWVLSATLWQGYVPRIDLTPWGLAVAIGITTLGQSLYVRVRHGDTWEELNFYEVVLAAGILLIAPTPLMVACLAGVLIGELLIRRGEWLKVAYNLGMYAAATGAMIATYHLMVNALAEIFGPNQVAVTSASSLVSLVIGSAVFTAVNLAILSLLLRATTGAHFRDVIGQEWRLSILMALGSVGVGFVAVALAGVTIAAIPFAFLPALALWYAYGASAQHAEARERNRWLVELGGHLAEHGQGASSLSDSVEAIRQIMGAPESAILDPATCTDAASSRMLATLAQDSGPRPLRAEELPAGWRTGVGMRLDLGTDQPGALLLGSTAPYRPSRITGRTRGWALDDADAPVLGALVAAVGSASRAGAAFATLTEERDKLTAVVDNTSDGIAMVDDAGRIRLWSRTMAQMTGVSGDLLGDSVASAPAIVGTLVQAARRGGEQPGSSPVQVSLVRRDGEALDVSVTTARVREATSSAEGSEPGWVSILTVHDETRERRVERMKTDFVATVSHELRTPITPIKGYAHLLASRRDRMNPEKVTEKLQLIASSADHLERLVDDLLMAQKVSGSTQLRVEMGVEDLGEVIRQAIDAVPEMALRVRVTLPEEPVEVRCDRERTVQCLVNLIGNADKYAPGSPVEISAQVVGVHAQVHVRDHGAGIPAAEREKVFERFYRREDPFTMRTGGAGLGLHIARELAVAMGGSLTLEAPADGIGSDFVLHLRTTDAPIVEVPEDRAASHGAVSEIRPGQAWRPPRSSSRAAGRVDTADTVTTDAPRDGTMEPLDDKRAAI